MAAATGRNSHQASSRPTAPPAAWASQDSQVAPPAAAQAGSLDGAPDEQGQRDGGAEDAEQQGPTEGRITDLAEGKKQGCWHGGVGPFGVGVAACHGRGRVFKRSASERRTGRCVPGHRGVTPLNPRRPMVKAFLRA